MWKVIATIAARPTHDYPFAVIAIDPQGKRLQEVTCQSRRDCLLVGNGTVQGLLSAGQKTTANVEFDSRVWN